MAYIEFERHLSVGNPAMDEQHREIFQLLNDLVDADEYGFSREKIQDTLGRIKRYTKFHFVSEERFMESIEYSGINEHTSLHRECTSEILDLENRYRSGEDVPVSEILDYLRDWFLNHIEETDKLYSPEKSPYTTP